MLTQREATEIMIAKLESHDFFNGGYVLNKKEAQIILNSLRWHNTRLNYGHDRYVDNREEHIKRAQERYKKKKTKIVESRRKKIYEKAREAVKE